MSDKTPFDFKGRPERYIFDKDQNANRLVTSEEEYEAGHELPNAFPDAINSPQVFIAPNDPEDRSIPVKQAPVKEQGKVDSPVLNKDSKQPLSPNPPEAGKLPNRNTSPGMVSTKDLK